MIPKNCLGIPLFVFTLTCCFYLLIAEDKIELTFPRIPTTSNDPGGLVISSTSWKENCDCGPNSEGCYFKGGYKVCKCHPRYKQTSNSTDSTCEECDCGANSVSCHYTNNMKICTCRKGDSGSTGKCLKCDCGIGAISCEHLINIGLKKCVCKSGYAPYSSLYNNFDEKCKECDCGPSSLSCKFKAGHFKECTCKPGSNVIRGGYLEGDKGCTKVCDCGLDSVSCSFDAFGNKKCICRTGYAYNKMSLSGEICQECICLNNATSCSFNSMGVKKCSCREGYAVKNTAMLGELCQKCDCGPHAISCRFNNFSERRMCSCRYGYVSKSESIYDDDECVKSGSSLSKGTSPWKIATYVTIALFAVIILSIMYTIRRERWQRWCNA